MAPRIAAATTRGLRRAREPRKRSSSFTTSTTPSPPAYRSLELVFDAPYPAELSTDSLTLHPGLNEEYSNLVRYISTYRDGRRKSTISIGSQAPAGDDEKQPPKWKFWAKKQTASDGTGFVPPEEWLNTDMKQGLSEADLAPRRKQAGWNELTTEKENLFIKFLGFFRGPILYGKLNNSRVNSTRRKN